MKSLKIIILLIAMGVSGNSFAQVLVRDGNNQSHVSRGDESIGTVKGVDGPKSGLFLAGGLGVGVNYGGYGGRFSLGYNAIGLSVAVGKTKGTLLSYSWLMSTVESDFDDTKLNKNNTEGTGFMVGLDLWLIPQTFYYNFSYVSMGKFKDTTLNGGLLGIGGRISVWDGLYIELAAHLGMLFPDLEDISMGMSGGGSIGVGYKF